MLTANQKGKVRNLILINEVPVRRAIALVKRRAARLVEPITYLGSVKRAEGYYIM